MENMRCSARCALPSFLMARCDKTGKGTGFGNTRSHSLRHTRRSWKANIQRKRVYDPVTRTYKVLKVSTSYLRTLTKRMQEGKVA